MPELPIVAEVSNWGAFILGAMLIVGAVAVVRVAWRLDSLKRIAGLTGALFPLVLGLVLTLQNVGWQLRIDQKGIALRAPFDPLWPGSVIGWPDVTAVDIVTHWYRDAHYILRIRGQRDVEILIASADQMPPQFVTQLRAAVAKLAPQVTSIKELDRQFQYAREHSTSVIANSYSVRDGRGVLLR